MDKLKPILTTVLLIISLISVVINISALHKKETDLAVRIKKKYDKLYYPLSAGVSVVAASYFFKINILLGIGSIVLLLLIAISFILDIKEKKEIKKKFDIFVLIYIVVYLPILIFSIFNINK